MPGPRHTAISAARRKSTADSRGRGRIWSAICGPPLPDRPPGQRDDAPADLREKVYGRRRGRRLRIYKSDLLETLLPRLAIEPPGEGARLDPTTLFDRMAGQPV